LAHEAAVEARRPRTQIKEQEYKRWREELEAQFGEQELKCKKRQEKEERIRRMWTKVE
jgi:hypothetical protein